MKLSRHIIIVIAMAASPLLVMSMPRTIKKVAPIVVNCPVGTSPNMPNRIWVTYRDGYSEYRQVKWANSPLSTEQDEANAQIHPAGSQYQLKGYIVGDETTDNGYPITASIKVVGNIPATPQHIFVTSVANLDNSHLSELFVTLLKVITPIICSL